jgi:salicylate hydroxylase
VLRHWASPDIAKAFQFFQDFRKPRTDRITSSSYETGKMASADIPEELWASAFSPSMVRERMRWVMEFDLLGELAAKLAAQFPEASQKQPMVKGADVQTASVL